jgi:hypothetical protein
VFRLRRSAGSASGEREAAIAIGSCLHVRSCGALPAVIFQHFQGSLETGIGPLRPLGLSTFVFMNIVGLKTRSFIFSDMATTDSICKDEGTSHDVHENKGEGFQSHDIYENKAT